MADNSVSCPQCGHNVSVTKALGAEIEERYKKEFQTLLSEREKEWAKKHSSLETEKEALARQKIEFETMVSDRLKSERSQLEQKINAERSQLEQRLQAERSELEQKLATERSQLEQKLKTERIQLEQKLKSDLINQNKLELEDLQNQLSEKSKLIENAQKAELELRKQKRELEEKEKNIELEMQRKFDAEKNRIEEETARRLTEDLRFKTLEKDKQLEDMRRQIEDLKRKAEQGSQQTQGEVLELEIETTLRSMFPMDIIEPVGKGIRGGDIIHRVMTAHGQNVGTIIWETKRTKAWSDGWVEKLKEDQRAIAAECAVIVTAVMPKGSCHLALVDGVWAVDYLTMAGIAIALRNQLLQVYHARAMAAGKDEKLDFLYSYLTGTQFKQRVEAIVEAFQSMQTDLEKEKRAIQKSWAAREQQIAKVLTSTVGMYGDIQGIIGSSLPKIQHLELSEAFESVGD